MNTILILYTELMPYNVAVIRALIKKDCRVHVVLQDTDKKTPYYPSEEEGVTYYKRSSFAKVSHLYMLVKRLAPDLIWTAGWLDPGYNKVVGAVRRKMHIPVVAGSDTQWRGGRQWLNVFTAFFRHHRWFSHLFVAGEWQMEYARKLGFREDQILKHNLSADVDLFTRIDLSVREKQYPRRLLYVGRFSKEKGLNYLLEAWKSIPDKKGWRLTLIGNGPERDKLCNIQDVEVLDFMDQSALLLEMTVSGAFILPSVFEPWALVLHEAACAGLPILSSNRCGAVTCFVKEQGNGYLFIPDNVFSIRRSIEKLITAGEDNWLRMGKNSRKLSLQITPEKVAETLLTVLR